MLPWRPGLTVTPLHPEVGGSVTGPRIVGTHAKRPDADQERELEDGSVLPGLSLGAQPTRL